MKWIRMALQAIGAATLFLSLAATAWILRERFTGGPTTPRTKDVQNVLKQGGISADGNFKLLAGYQSPRTFTGDHLDYFCIQLARFELEDNPRDYWHDGPEKDPLLATALADPLELARNEGGACILSAGEANSVAVKMRFWSVDISDREPYAADIFLYDPRNKMLYFISYKS